MSSAERRVDRYHCVVIGAGHNGLTCASYAGTLGPQRAGGGGERPTWRYGHDA